MMDGLFYRDTRAPHMAGQPPAVTLTTSLQALMTPMFYPHLGPNYFGWVGKAIKMTCWGVATTGATPGNITVTVLWGNGSNNSGSQFNGVAMTGVVNLTATVWRLEYYIRCKVAGATGTVMVGGVWMQQSLGFVMLPPTGNGSIGTYDLTQDFIPSIQVSRSGSTVETMQVTDFFFEALN